MFIVAMFLVGVHLQASNGEEIFIMSDLESLDYFFIVVFKRKLGLAIKLR
jgi:Kef-type K+ transport system membrane component KefB